MTKRMKSFALLAALLALSGASCNIWDPFDSPSGDAQLLSAARACFDNGDITCAKDYYAKLSGDSADIQKSETVFALLAEQGVTMQEFMTDFGSGGGGKGITALANALWSHSLQPSPDKRTAIFAAFKIAITINDAGLRGLARFLSAVSLLAEMSAESAGDDHVLTATDWATSPASCKASGTCTGCTGAFTPTTTGSTFNLETATVVTGASTPSQWQMQAAVNQISTALGSTELNAGGDFASGIGGFSSATQSAVIASGCFIQSLLNQGIGG